MIQDSGTRREFKTGAVRDIQEGKGRCDLLPLDTIARFFITTEDIEHVFGHIDRFQTTNDARHLRVALDYFLKEREWDHFTMFLEVAKHFEEGAQKYGERNWQKGIPTHCYIDSAVRHFMKWLRGDSDEPHDRAFCWNILCCIWTCNHQPELNDYPLNAKAQHSFSSSSEDINTAERAYRFVVSYLSTIVLDFSVGKYMPKSNTILILKSELEKILSGNGYQFDAVKKNWKERGYLKPNSQGKCFHHTSINNIKGCYIEIVLPS